MYVIYTNTDQNHVRDPIEIVHSNALCSKRLRLANSGNTLACVVRSSLERNLNEPGVNVAGVTDM